MSNNTPPGQSPHSKHDETPRPPTHDEQLKHFWVKNEKNIYIACLLVILVVAGYTFVRYLQGEKESEIGAAYVSAVHAADGGSARIKAFIAANPGHSLAAAAELRLADDAYTAKNYAEAASSYEKAAAACKQIAASLASEEASGIRFLAGRAQLGAAMSKTLAGLAAEGETKFKQVSNDNTLPVDIRAEATYHLAEIAAKSGRADEAAKLYEQVSAIARDSLWANRATEQRTLLTSTTTVQAVPATPAQPAPASAPAAAQDGLPNINFPATSGASGK